MTFAQPMGLIFLWLILLPGGDPPFPEAPLSLPPFCPKSGIMILLQSCHLPAQLRSAPRSLQLNPAPGHSLSPPLDGPTTSLSPLKPLDDHPLLSDNAGLLTRAHRGSVSCLLLQSAPCLCTSCLFTANRSPSSAKCFQHPRLQALLYEPRSFLPQLPLPGTLSSSSPPRLRPLCHLLQGTLLASQIPIRISVSHSPLCRPFSSLLAGLCHPFYALVRLPEVPEGWVSSISGRLGTD